MDVIDQAKAPTLKQAIVRGVSAAVLYFLALMFVFSVWVHYFYAGSYSGPIMISTLFGMSDASRAAGAKIAYVAPHAGWDGQFYFTQSNDPFMLREDYTKCKLMDLVSYRFQRNGLPLLARGLSAATGSEYTSPFLYLLTQFLITSVGFGVLVAYLSKTNASLWWSLVWVLNGGVLLPMAHGLPDPTADTMLLITILAAVNQRLILYSIAASILCLCRESYAAPAAVIWLMTVFNAINWKDRGYAARFVLTSLPGVVVLSWAAYVAYRTQTGILSGSRSIAWGGLVDFPFVAYVRCSRDDLRAGLYWESFLELICAACISVVLVYVVMRAKSVRITWAILPHVILMTMTGWIVWETPFGFLKNTSSIVLLGVLLLPLYKSLLLRSVLIVNFVVSLFYFYTIDYRDLQFLPPLPERMTAVQAVPLVGTAGEIEYASKVELVDITSLGGSDKPYEGFFAWCHREGRIIKVRVTNQSRLTWPASSSGADAITVGVQVLDNDRIVSETRISIPKSVAPGESFEVEYMAPKSSGSRPSRFIRFGLVHDGHRWFSSGDDQQKLDVPN